MPDQWKPERFFTSEEIEAQMTPAGGFSKESLAKLGVPWPPPKGWRKAITKDDYAIRVDGVWRREKKHS